MASLFADEHREVISVGELTRQVRASLQSGFRELWVAGEVSDLSRPRSGHIYFTLKDDDARLSAVIWRTVAESLPFALADGMQIQCFGGLDVFPPQGRYQLIVRRVEAKGEGALQAALRKLRTKLASEGLFDAARKRPLPRFPQRIAVVTSPSGAALRDFLEVARRRWLGPEIFIFPTRVQGEGATAEIIAAIQLANRSQPRPDVLVVTRGGGSIEDLWSFNDESVVRSIFASEVPVVSAIGHEVDVTLADLVADCRALTPSEAAERVIPSADELQGRLRQLHARLAVMIAGHLRHLRARWQGLSSRAVFTRPWDLIRERAERLDQLEARLERAWDNCTRQCRERADLLKARLAGLDPLAILARGYSVTQLAKSGETIKNANQVASGDRLSIRLAEGRISSIVEEPL